MRLSFEDDARRARVNRSARSGPAKRATTTTAKKREEEEEAEEKGGKLVYFQHDGLTTRQEEKNEFWLRLATCRSRFFLFSISQSRPTTGYIHFARAPFGCRERNKSDKPVVVVVVDWGRRDGSLSLRKRKKKRGGLVSATATEEIFTQPWTHDTQPTT